MPQASVRTRLSVESLDPRIVPSATRLDLTHRGAEATAAGAIVRQVDGVQPNASALNSFVRLDDHRCDGTEQGYNTDARPVQFDERRNPRVTHSLTLGSVPIVEVNGVRYREFVLDINQNARSPYLSLDEVRIFLGNSPTLNNYDARRQTLGGRSAVFNLDATRDVSVILNGRLNQGHGRGDMVLLVPDAVFANANPNTFVYLYSKFGGVSGAHANGGFEEWSVRCPSQPPPPPPTGPSTLSGRVFQDFDNNGVFDAGEFGLQNVEIRLTGTDDRGNAVDVSVFTGLDGTYSFTGVRPGTYEIEEVVQPSGFTSGINNAGSLGGEVEGDRIFGITVGANQTGLNYNFAELFFSEG